MTELVTINNGTLNYRVGTNEIITTGLAGGLYCPYKGLLPATSQDVLNCSPTAHLFR